VLGIFLFMFAALVTLLGVAIAWRQWFNTRLALGDPAWRRALGFASILGSSMQILLFVLFEAAIVITGNGDYRRRDFPHWAAVDFYLFALVVIAAVLGKGRFRFSALISSAAMTGVWLLLGMAM
jgi:hypothetical protein